MGRVHGGRPFPSLPRPSKMSAPAPTGERGGFGRGRGGDRRGPRRGPRRGARKDEVMKIMPVQKQTRAGQRTRFKAFVAIGDFDGHLGLGVKCAKEVATAIRGAIILAKLSVVPVRRGYWGAKLGEPHTVPCKVSGKTASVYVKCIPAPRGTGIVAAPASKRMLQLAGIEDVYTQSRGNTSTMGNFIKATYA